MHGSVWYTLFIELYNSFTTIYCKGGYWLGSINKVTGDIQHPVQQANTYKQM